MDDLLSSANYGARCDILRRVVRARRIRRRLDGYWAQRVSCRRARGREGRIGGLYFYCMSPSNSNHWIWKKESDQHDEEDYQSSTVTRTA